jgi:hypothetical protein
MMDDSDTVAGTAVKLVLIGIVLASGAVGTIGLDDPTPRATADGVTVSVAGDRASELPLSLDSVIATPGTHLADDGSARLLFPIPNATGVATVSRLAFPIDNATFLWATARTTADTLQVEIGSTASNAPWDVQDTDVSRFVLAVSADAPRQDMDPY